MLLRRLWQELSAYKRQLVVILGLIVVGEALGALNPYVWGRLLDFAYGKAAINGPAIFAALCALRVLNQLVMPFLRQSYEDRHYIYRQRREMEVRAINKTLALSIGQLARSHTANIKDIVDKGQTSIGNFVSAILYTVLPALVTAASGLVITFHFSLFLGEVTSLGALAGLLAMLYSQRVLMPARESLDIGRRQVYKLESEIYRNATAIIASGNQATFAHEYDQRKRASDADFMTWRERATAWFRLRNIPTLLTSLFILGYGVVQVRSGLMTAGFFLMFVGQSEQVLTNVSRIGQQQYNLLEALVAIRAYLKHLDMPSDVVEAQNPLRLPVLRGQIEFRDVTVRHPAREGEGGEAVREAEAALLAVSVKLEAGETVALVGTSGAGKTTFVKTLLRAFDPENGRILIDGEDLRLLELHAYRAQVGYVPQEVAILDRSFRDNITFGLSEGEEPSAEDLDRVIQLACLEEVVAELEHGLDTLLGERGVNLSGGQRQRVGIARALVRDPSILILDEATSHLDAESEHRVQEALAKARVGRTTLVVAHRFSTIRSAHRILVFEAGRVIDQGRHAELLLRCEPYRQLVERQRVGGF